MQHELERLLTRLFESSSHLAPYSDPMLLQLLSYVLMALAASLFVLIIPAYLFGGRPKGEKAEASRPAARQSRQREQQQQRGSRYRTPSAPSRPPAPHVSDDEPSPAPRSARRLSPMDIFRQRARPR